jgi:hypothetical protein
MTFIIDSYRLRDDLSIIAHASVGERFVIEKGKITERMKPDSIASNAFQNSMKWINNNIYGEEQSTKRAIGIIQELIAKIFLKLKSINYVNLSSIEISTRKQVIINFHSILNTLKKNGIPNFMTTIKEDGAHFFSTSEEIKNEHLTTLTNILIKIGGIQNIAEKIFKKFKQNPPVYTEKKLNFITHNDSLSEFISWIRNPNVIRTPNVSQYPAEEIKNILAKEFSLKRIDSVLIRYGLSECSDLSGVDIQALYIGLSATMTKADLDVFLAHPENINLSPIEVVKHYRSLKTFFLPLADNCPYKEALEIDMGLLKLHHLVEKYQVRQCISVGDPNKPIGYVELLGLYFARYFSLDYQASKHPQCLEDKILLIYPSPDKDVLVELHPHYLNEFHLFFLIAVPVSQEEKRLSILCRKMEDLKQASLLSLNYWWREKPATISSSLGTIGWEIIDRAFNLNFDLPQSAILDLIGFENECQELIENMKNQIQYFCKDTQHSLHKKANTISAIRLQKIDSIPSIDSDDPLEVNYYSSISYLKMVAPDSALK